MLNVTVHIRDVCVFLAPVFSGLTAISTFLLTRELWNQGAGLLAACFIAIVPGYISRSVAGSFDNEGIAIFALQFTYYLWVSNCWVFCFGKDFWFLLQPNDWFFLESVEFFFSFLSSLFPLAYDQASTEKSHDLNHSIIMLFILPCKSAVQLKYVYPVVVVIRIMMAIRIMMSVNLK